MNSLSSELTFFYQQHTGSVSDQDFGILEPRVTGEPSDDPTDDDLPAMEASLQNERELMEECARTPLFVGAKLTQLSCTLLLLNCLGTHKASNALVNELFQLLAAYYPTSILSRGQNTQPLKS